MLPQVNALLTRVSGGGGSEDWDQPEGAGDDLWVGSASACFTENRERTFGEQSDDLIRRTLIVETSLRTWNEGETAHFRYGATAMTGTVQMVEARYLPGTGALSTTRLTLEVQ